MKEENNTFLWDRFKHTDPSYTKPFPKFGKTLTTIDPMYQVMTMTRVFGPVGKGWSYDAKYHYTDANVFAEVKIVYCVEDIWYRYGPVSSVCALYKKAGTLDDEAPKKALTDAMTKAFSHLGNKMGDFPVAEDVSNRIFSLPMHPYLSKNTVFEICEAVKESIFSIA